MREALKGVSLLLAALFLFSALTPEPADVLGYNDNGVPAFVESDAAFALCSSPTVAIECHLSVGSVPLLEQVFFAPTLTVPSNLYRGPPTLF